MIAIDIQYRMRKYFPSHREAYITTFLTVSGIQLPTCLASEEFVKGIIGTHVKTEDIC